MPMASGLVYGGDDGRRGFRRIGYLLILLVIVPTGLLLALGIVMMALWQGGRDIVFGILVVAMVAWLITGAVLALVFLQREANLSKLQLDFVSKVSHELRTPLTSIRMFAEMLHTDDGRDAEHTRVCLEVLQKETTRLTERIERLLDWGRMESGRRIYQRAVESPSVILEEAMAAFRASTLGRERVVRPDVKPSLPEVVGDRGALVDALVNLLSNADKYSPETEEITLTATADARSVRLSVADHGIGIPRREHRRIFEKFYRVDERLSRAVEGSGLGLSIVQHVALGHGGRVEVESEPGRGSTFTIVLPKPSPDALEAARPSAPSLPPKATRATGESAPAPTVTP
jgi:two-component system phosphate regulon sensor histidine kinase PhoR